MDQILSHWSNYYILTGTAAVTLMGLMFIAVTFGQKIVTPQTVHLAQAFLSPIMYHFVHVFLIACAMLIPYEKASIIATVVIAIAAFRLSRIPRLVSSMKEAQAMRHDIETSDWVLNVYVPVVLYLFFIASGVSLACEQEWPYYGMAVGVLGLLVLGVVSAWEMLVWMASRVTE